MTSTKTTIRTIRGERVARVWDVYAQTWTEHRARPSAALYASLPARDRALLDTLPTAEVAS